MKLCDAHCHLQDERTAPYLDRILERARLGGVEAFVCCGSAESDWDAVRKLASNNGDIIPQYGLHPWYIARRSDEWLSSLQTLLISNPAAGLGEAGLDHALTARDDEDQLSVLTDQLKLACELQRPVSLHCRRAWGAMVEALSYFGPSERGLVFHSFSGSAELLPELCRLGGYFSFSGAITFSGNKRGRKALQAVPLDRLLIETDSPDLHPNMPPAYTDSKGRPVNEPGNLTHVLKAVSEIINIPEETLAAVTWENAGRVFGVHE